MLPTTQVRRAVPFLSARLLPCTGLARSPLDGPPLLGPMTWLPAVLQRLLALSAQSGNEEASGSTSTRQAQSTSFRSPVALAGILRVPHLVSSMESPASCSGRVAAASGTRRWALICHCVMERRPLRRLLVPPRRDTRKGQAAPLAAARRVGNGGEAPVASPRGAAEARPLAPG
jgi:hypothetical protein